MTYELAKAGVKLMAGSDSPEWFLVQGFSIHDELETFAKTGMDLFERLKTATINPATYLSINKAKGTIDIGKDADLILLEKNPLENISNTRSICGVMAGGKWFDREQLNLLLNEAKSELS